MGLAQSHPEELAVTDVPSDELAVSAEQLWTVVMAASVETVEYFIWKQTLGVIPAE